MTLHFARQDDVSRRKPPSRCLHGASLIDVLLMHGVSESRCRALKSTAAIIPFKTTDYIVEELIDWEAAPDDPVFKMNFPEPRLLHETDLATVQQLHESGAGKETIDAVSRQIQCKMVSGAEGGSSRGVPLIAGEPAIGVFHNFPYTVFLFPDIIDTCFANCNYCIRWAKQLRLRPPFTYRDPTYPLSYLASTDAVTDVIFSGGDAFNTTAKQLGRFVQPLLDIEHLRTIRFSTRALSWRPTRLTTDIDADDLLRLLEKIISHKKHVSIMVHLTHPTELSTPTVEAAVARLRSTGAVVRGQGPLVKGINDTSEILAALWRREVQLGIVPYYLFLESQRGHLPVYKLSPAAALSVFKGADASVGGLAKTIRGPVYNFAAMKLLVDDEINVNGKKQLLLKCLQSENPSEAGHRLIFPTERIDADSDVVGLFRKLSI
jgi:L-lysine 2,3-aminomutase